MRGKDMRMTRRNGVVGLLAILVGSAAGAGEPGVDFGAVAIARSVDALTFARVGAGVVLVTEFRDDRISGVNLSCSLGRPVADPIEVFLAEGYRRLRILAATRDPDCQISSLVADLALPVNLGERHVAAGTNFPAHAGEADVRDGPFLFAKLVAPTPHRAPVAAGDALLDYEVELAWVPLQPLRRGEMPDWMGLILCNDYTDRATLLREIDPWDVASGTGFTTGKSFPGYLPVGNLFVIPADYRSFAAALQLRLYVNGELRQSGRVDDAIWDIDQLVEQTWQWQDRRWKHRGAEVSLLAESDVIPARALIMGGTPSGTVFRGISRRRQLAGALGWVLGGWDRPIAAHVVESYIAAARAEKRYLQPGDRVVIRVDRMGTIDNPIEE